MGKEKMYYEQLGYDFDPPFYREEDKPVVTNWKPIKCPRCGGPLSELRKYRYGGGPIGELAKYSGKWYRHCYSCHAEIFVEE